MRFYKEKHLAVICALSFIITSCANLSKNYKEGIEKEAAAGFPLYGNWCGRGHPKLGEAPAPVDDLDGACMQHDVCYCRKDKDLSCECDVQLIRDIENIKFPSQADTISEVINAKLVLTYFLVSPCKGVKDMALKAHGTIERSVGIVSPDHWVIFNPVAWIVAGIYIGILYLINDVLGPTFTNESDQSDQTPMKKLPLNPNRCCTF